MLRDPFPSFRIRFRGFLGAQSIYTDAHFWVLGCTESKSVDIKEEKIGKLMTVLLVLQNLVSSPKLLLLTFQSLK